MARTLRTKQLRDFSNAEPSNGDVPTWNATAGKYEPAPPGAGSLQIIVTDDVSGNIVTDDVSGDVVWNG